MRLRAHLARWAPNRVSKTSRGALTLAALAVALGGCGSDSDGRPAAGAGAPSGAGGPPSAPPVPVKVAQVIEQPAVERLTFIATVGASVSTTVGAEVAGQVVEVRVREGDAVVAGRTVLARLDTGPRSIELREAVAAVAKAREEFDKLRRGSREEEVAQREAEVAAQEAVLERAESDYRRAQQLYRDELIARAELQRQESEYLAAKHRHRQLVEALRLVRKGPRPEEIAQAEAELARAQARADRIRDEIQRSTIHAPLSAFLIARRVDVGAWVQPGTPVADLVVLDPAYVTGPVGERQIRWVQRGQPAAITVDAYPGRTFEGQVTAIIPDADPTSRTFPVRATVANPAGLLKAGMFARVGIRIGAERRALFVPRDALLRRGREDLLYVVNDGRAHVVRVETGIDAGDLVEVRAPELRPGQPIVTLGNELLQPGAPVEVVR